MTGILNPINLDKRTRRMIVPEKELLALIKKGYGIAYIAAHFQCTEENIRESYNRYKRPSHQRKL